VKKVKNSLFVRFCKNNGKNNRLVLRKRFGFD